MDSTLLLEQVSPEGSSEVARLTPGEHIIGRDPGVSVSINNKSISREHGIFRFMGTDWYYRDLGSTNGSWHNQLKLKEGKWRLLRNNDLIQTSDVILKMSLLDSQGVTPALEDGRERLVVFERGDYLGEYLVPEYGRALVIGGRQGDLRIVGSQEDMPSFIAEKRGAAVAVYGIAPTSEILVNDNRIADRASLKHGDDIVVSYYNLIYSNPAQIASMKPAGASGSQQWSPTASQKQLYDDTSYNDSAPNKAPRGSANFGSPDEQADYSHDEEPSYNTRQRHHSGAYGVPDGNAGSLEDKIVLAVGLMLMLLVIILLVWFLFL